MASTLPDDILLPGSESQAARRPVRSRLAAFVPISIAIVGVVAILVGRVSVHDVTANGLGDGIDPVVTGSVKAASRPAADQDDR